MLSVMNESQYANESCGWFKYHGKLVAISAIMLSASAAMSLADQYPISTFTPQSASIDRACTQLEQLAKMTPSECGTLTLADVIARVHALQMKSHDE